MLWFTGLSGAGKSTIANLVEKKLAARGRHTFLLDGDNVRHGLNRDLGFTEADRIENIRRVGEVARLMADAGLIVLTAFISPFRAERAHGPRGWWPEGEFFEIFVDTPLADAEKRDTKGLYAKARAGELKNFTGIDSPYEPPESAGDPHRHDGDERRGSGEPDRRGAAQPALMSATSLNRPNLLAISVRYGRATNLHGGSYGINEEICFRRGRAPAGLERASAQDSRDIRVRVGAGAELRPTVTQVPTLTRSGLCYR